MSLIHQNPLMGPNALSVGPGNLQAALWQAPPWGPLRRGWLGVLRLHHCAHASMQAPTKGKLNPRYYGPYCAHASPLLWKLYFMGMLSFTLMKHLRFSSPLTSLQLVHQASRNTCFSYAIFTSHDKQLLASQLVHVLQTFSEANYDITDLLKCWCVATFAFCKVSGFQSWAEMIMNDAAQRLLCPLYISDISFTM